MNITIPKKFAHWWKLHRKLKALDNDDLAGFCEIVLEFDQKNPGELRIITELPEELPHTTPRIRLASKEEYYDYARRVSERIFREGILAELEMENTVREGRHLRLLEGERDAE